MANSPPKPNDAFVEIHVFPFETQGVRYTQPESNQEED